MMSVLRKIGQSCIVSDKSIKVVGDKAGLVESYFFFFFISVPERRRYLVVQKRGISLVVGFEDRTYGHNKRGTDLKDLTEPSTWA